MSATQYFASIQSNAEVRYVASGRIVSGSIADTKKAVIEPLETVGVDGRRFRSTYRQKDPIVISGVEPCSDFQKIERLYTKLVGKLVTLTIRINGQLLRYKNATVTGFTPTRRIGKLTGYGETSDPYSLSFTITIECPNTEPT